MRRSDTLDFSLRDVAPSRLSLAKYTDYMLVHLKLSSKYPDISTSFSWTFWRDHVVNLWWLVVVVRHIIISVVLVVEGDVDSSD